MMPPKLRKSIAEQLNIQNERQKEIDDNMMKTQDVLGEKCSFNTLLPSALTEAKTKEEATYVGIILGSGIGWLMAQNELEATMIALLK